MRRLSVIAIALSFACCSFALAEVSDSATLPATDRPDVIDDEGSLIREALVAAGVEPTDPDLISYQNRIERALADIVWRVGPGKPSYRRANKLHRVLHRNYFESYDIEVDGLQRVVEDGSYNCLSSVLFTGLAARRLGFETHIIEYPGHLVIELDTRTGPVMIEATSPFGFDIQPTRFRRSNSNGSFGSAWLLQANDGSWRVPLSSAIGFTWLNRAWRSFEMGQTLEAVDHLERAASFVPGLSEQVEAAPRLLARAFVREYDAGRFDAAFRIAELDSRLSPGRVTSEDRLLAAAQKRIERLAVEGELAHAVSIRERLVETVLNESSLARFDRTTGPTIVAAAVRQQAWEVAARFVERYALSEPDPIEIDRLRAWVDSRQLRMGPPDPRWIPYPLSAMRP